MKKMNQLLTFLFCLFCFNVSTQSSSDIIGSWKMDFDANKALLSEEDKSKLSPESENTIRPMMANLAYTLTKEGVFEMYHEGKKNSKDGSTWELKGKTLSIKIGDNNKGVEIKKWGKNKLIWHDKNENGSFKTRVLVPAK